MAPKSSCQHPTRHAERDKPSKWTKAVSAALAYYMTNRYNKYVSLSKFKIKEGDPLCVSCLIYEEGCLKSKNKELEQETDKDV
ncbi:unnamed protein product, partial [Didymodactylos carnosus]